MTDFQNTIDLLGDDVVARAIAKKTISEFNDDKLTSIKKYAFYSCPDLKSVDLPNVTSIGENAFEDCDMLTSVNFKNVTSIGKYAFMSCAALANVNFPNVTSVVDSAFRGCTSLTSVDLPNVTRMPYQVFYGCSQLTTVILRSTTLCENSSGYNLMNTPFYTGGQGGTLLVPRDLVENYKTATTWKTLWDYGHNRFLALEDYTIDGTITGEIDWDKLNG